MSESLYLRPSSEVTVEFKERRSLFLGHVRIASSEDEAKACLKALNDKYKDATHNCWAYRIGFPQYQEYYSDAGEPSGTAGKPISGAISRSGITDVIVIVTRYFGGIKLGVRGLIEAYGRAAIMALDAADPILYVPTRSVNITVPYDSQRSIMHLLKTLGVGEDQANIDYTDVVTITVSIPLQLSDQISELFPSLHHKGQILTWAWIS